MERQPTAYERTLQALVLRLLTPPQTLATPTEQRELLVERLPHNLPVDVPVMPGLHVLGSLVRGLQITIVLDSDKPAQAVLDWYRDQLQASGWTIQEPPRPSGFLPTFWLQQQGLTFCHSTHGPSLTVHALDVSHAPAQVTLLLNSDPRLAPCRASQRQSGTFGLQRRLPILVAPPASRQIAAGGGGSATYVYSAAVLETDMDLTGLVTYYSRQLEQAGWTRTNAGQDGPFAWSTWSLTDQEGEPMRGFFFIIDRPDAPREYYLHVEIGYPTARGATSGGMSIILPHGD